MDGHGANCLLMNFWLFLMNGTGAGFRFNTESEDEEICLKTGGNCGSL